MAEIVVKAQNSSVFKRVLETGLDATFPLWGVIAPAVAVFTGIASVVRIFEKEGAEFFAGFIVLSTYSVLCLILKRALAQDFITIDQQGIRLPRFHAGGIHLRRYTPWSQVTHVGSRVSHDESQNSALIIARTKGRPMTLRIGEYQTDFAEQMVLAAKMWAPDRCDDSLEQLQDTLRLTDSRSSSSSFTEIWEDELGRRFNPTAYIPLEAGRVLHNNTLRIVRQLASGGLSALYLCQQNDKLLVVLKESVIPSHTEEGVKEKAREMFDREAQLLMKLNHKSVVRVLDTFVEADRNYLVLEYASGMDLRNLVKQKGAQNEANVLDWAVQVANTLKYLHEREVPILHRDLTPDNIVLKNDGQIMIVDFGAANEFIGNATGTFVGKHAYIAPEQLRGKATVQSDIYAFGGTLHYLLTGVEPEALSSSRPKDLVPDISDELSEFVESCTQMEAAERFQTVSQLLPVLKRLAAQSVVV